MILGTGHAELITGATTRRKLIATPGRMAHSARRYTLHLPPLALGHPVTRILEPLRTVRIAT